MKDEILLIYIVNALAASILFMFSYRHSSDRSGGMRFLICLAAPPVGFLWTLLFQCAPGNQAEENCENIRRPVHIELDGGHEDRIVPMSEALVMNDHLVCCSMLIDALKEDPIKYAASIRKALEIGDTETAHYAAAAVMRMQRTLMEKINRIEAQYVSGTAEIELLEDYASALEACLDSKLFDEATETQMHRSMEKILGVLLARQPTPEAFARMVELQINRNNLKKSLNYLLVFLKRYPDEERAYLLYIECMVRQNNGQGLRDFLAALPRLPVKLTPVTLQYIRCFISAGFKQNQ